MTPMPARLLDLARVADVYRMCNEGAHGVEVGARDGFIRQAERLARWLQVQK